MGGQAGDWVRCLSGTLAVLVLGAPALAADFDTLVDLPTGTQLDVTVTRSRTDGLAPTTMTFRYRQALTQTDEGYRVAQRLTGVDYPPNTSPDEKAAIDQGLATVSEITYDADPSLAPVAIVDYERLVDGVIDSIRRATPAGGDAAKAVEAVRDMYVRLGPEGGAASLLKEQQMAAAMQNVVISTDEPIEGSADVPNPFGGPPIGQTVSVSLEGVDASSGRAVIRMTEVADPDSLAVAMRRFVGSLAARAGKPPPDLSTLNVERSTVCRSEMDLVTGLAAKVECTATTTTLDQAAMLPVQRIDTWVITQAVVK